MASRKENRKPDAATDGGNASAADPVGEKNEKVLHARIPGSLDREIKRRARGLGMSVSTVVRNVLLHTFDLVEDIVIDSANIALSIAGDEETPPAATAPRRRRAATERTAGGSPDASVLAWQEAVLNLNAVCSRCNAMLTKGTGAAVGIRETPGPQSIICTTCLATLRPSRIEPGQDG